MLPGFLRLRDGQCGQGHECPSLRRHCPCDESLYDPVGPFGSVVEGPVGQSDLRGRVSTRGSVPPRPLTMGRPLGPREFLPPTPHAERVLGFRSAPSAVTQETKVHRPSSSLLTSVSFSCVGSGRFYCPPGGGRTGLDPVDSSSPVPLPLSVSRLLRLSSDLR